MSQGAKWRRPRGFGLVAVLAILLAPLVMTLSAGPAGAVTFETLSGHVFYGDGTPAAGLVVGVDNSLGPLPFQATVAADGSYAVSWEGDPGTVSLFSSTWTSSSFPNTIVRSPIALTGDQVLDLTYPSVDAHLHVVDATDIPIAGAEVDGPGVGGTLTSPIDVQGGSLYPGAPSTLVYGGATTGTTDASGNATLRPFRHLGGTQALSITKGGYSSVSTTVDAEVDTSTTVSLTRFVTTPGTIGGTVTGPGGAPMAGLKVRLYDAGTGLVVKSALVGQVGPGEYRFAKLTPGTYHVRFGPDGNPPGGPQKYVIQWNGAAVSMAAAPVLVLATGQGLEVDAAMQLGGSITGQLDNHLGAGLNGPTTVRFYDEASGLASKVTTSSTGAYQIDDLAPGTYHVRFGDGVFVPPVWYGNTLDEGSSSPVTVIAGGSATADAQLPPPP